MLQRYSTSTHLIIQTYGKYFLYIWGGGGGGGGRSGGAMVLYKLSAPGRPIYLDISRARAYNACSGCEWGCLDIFFAHLFSLFLSPVS